MSVDAPLGLLRQVVGACGEAGAAYAIIGGVARNAWAAPRATADLDLAVVVPPAIYAPLLARLEAAGLTVRRTITADSKELVPDLVLLVHRRRDRAKQIAVHRRPSLGTPTQEYREYFEEA
ncbi:MAG: hypothetical protein ABI629_16495 [bacterium]